MLTSRHALERKKNTTVGVHSCRGGLFTQRLKKWVKAVFLLGCYGCIFHGTVNSAQLCQNFGISGGVWTPQPPALGTPLVPVLDLCGALNVNCLFCHLNYMEFPNLESGLFRVWNDIFLQESVLKTTEGLRNLYWLGDKYHSYMQNRTQ